MRALVLAVVVSTLTLGIGHRATAQAVAATPASSRNLITVQPLIAVAGVFSGDYERAVGSSGLTLGANVSHWNLDLFDHADATSVGYGLTYSSAEAKLRYYVSEQAFHGLSFGVTAGGVQLHQKFRDFDGHADRMSSAGAKLGAELDYTWLLGRRQQFAIALGVGGKRVLVHNSDDFYDPVTRYITSRVAIGWAF